mmetsp:Transcript_62584/g.116401  ORF Transcript_62584/g.116401 Transcript_62584/m.116401 type:complete len:351 (+) Transcript_62584:101-1153(+)
MDESKEKLCQQDGNKALQIVSNKSTATAQQRQMVLEVDEEEEVALLKERLARARYDQAVASSAADEAEVKANLLRQELEDAHVAVMGYHQDCSRLQQRNAQLQQLVEKLTQEMAQKDANAEPSASRRAAAKARQKETARDAASQSQARRTASSTARQRPSTARTGTAMANSRGERNGTASRGPASRSLRGPGKDLQPSRGASPLTSGRSSARTRGRTAPSRAAVGTDPGANRELAAQARADLLRRRNNLDFEIRQLESLAMQVQELEPLLLEAWREAQEARSSGSSSGHSVSTLGLEVEAMVETIERSLHLGPSPYLSFRDLHKDLIEDPGNRPPGSRLSRLLPPKSKPA